MNQQYVVKGIPESDCCFRPNAIVALLESSLS